ncbi:hypothetical protein [Nocardia nova]|uniref:hypothetical protein n=1 Tax=Nocardia nova TaxID=37330 RepID=UPI000CEA3851|nr:hypothetical protein [Nocardia nova]PPI89074.1 hypothetical protein C5E46_35100 [Nocardia nova]
MTNISVEHAPFGPDPSQPAHALRGGRPEGLPLSAAVYDVSVTYGRRSAEVVEALYEAVKSLEAELVRRGD